MQKSTLSPTFLSWLLVAGTVFLLLACEAGSEQVQEDPSYTISGKVDSLFENKQVILSTFNPITQVRTVLDTVLVDEEGNYALSYPFDQPDLYRIDFFRKQSVMLAIDKGQNTIELNVEGIKNGKVKITGSEDSEKLQGYEAFRMESNRRLVRPTYEAMNVATDNGDTAAEVAAVEAYSKANQKHRQELIDYTDQNIGTSVALYGTMLRWTGDDAVDRLDQLVQNFKTAHPDLQMTGIMEEKVERFKRVAIGAKAPEIAMPDTSGQLIKLSEQLGEYTLIDFWASWCGPCILQFPDLKEAYANYHDRGFEVFSVSVDSRQNKWKNAIKKHEINWINVSDVQGWQSAAAAHYNVTFIPFNFLLDKEGRIIAKNLHSKTLQSKLEELLGAVQ